MQEFSQNYENAASTLRINLSALADNYRLFQSMVGEGRSVAGVVKANAYGLGLQAVVQSLVELECTQFFVATLEEALQFRTFNKNSDIAVLGGLFKDAEDTYAANNITPVLNTPDDMARWRALASQKSVHLPALIHFDTGMNRLGLSHDEATALIQDKSMLDGLDIKYVMTHFACADEKDHPLTRKQAHNFANIAQHFPDAKKSLANSPGLFRNESYHHDMARPGYSLYGGNPTPETQNPVKSVVSLHTRILQTRECKKGESIGYGASCIFDKDTRTATVALGYADGFLRSANNPENNGSIFYYNGQPCRVLGRVSMDLVTIDLSNIQGEPPQQGDAIEILGPHQTIDDLANSKGTIGYEILTSLGTRYKREYV